MLITKAVSKFAGLLVLTLTLGGASLGQIKSGTIVGEATDPNGAAVPGANVSAINQETNVASTTVTDDSGNFTVPYLAPGTYTVNVEKSGFARYNQNSIT